MMVTQVFPISNAKEKEFDKFYGQVQFEFNKTCWQSLECQTCKQYRKMQLDNMIWKSKQNKRT